MSMRDGEGVRGAAVQIYTQLSAQPGVRFRQSQMVTSWSGATEKRALTLLTRQGAIVYSRRSPKGFYWGDGCELTEACMSRAALLERELSGHRAHSRTRASMATVIEILCKADGAGNRLRLLEEVTAAAARRGVTHHQLAAALLHVCQGRARVAFAEIAGVSL